jgi:hypothetical protein
VTQFRVDLDVLVQLSNQLAVIHDSLSSAKDDIRNGGYCTGSDAVYAALNGFQTGWKDGRKKIEDEISSLSGAVAGVAQDYLTNETKVQQSFTVGQKSGK